MKTFSVALAVSLLVVGCSKEEKPTPAPAPGSTPPAAEKPAASSGSVITAPLDYVAAAGKAQQLAIKTIDLTSLSQAVQLFNAQEGRNPKDLNELVTMKYIGKLPAAPYGKKLAYDAATGKVSVVDQQP